MLSLVEKQRLDSATTLDEVCRLLWGEDPVRTVDWDMKLGVREAVVDSAYMEALAERIMRADLGLAPQEGLHRVRIGTGQREQFWEPVDTGFASWLDLLREGCRQLRPMTRFEPVADEASRILFRIFVKRSRAVVLMLLRNAGNALRWLGGASERLRADREVVLAAVRQNGQALQHASEGLQKDRVLVLTAVQLYGMALQWAYEDLRDDKEVVLAAVSQDGRALRLASQDLYKDREVVLAAVRQNGEALMFAPRELKNDKEVVLAAVRKNPDAFLYVSVWLSNDKEVKRAAGRK